MPKPTFRIIPECHADTALARLFIADVKREDHANGSSAVAVEMKKETSLDVVLIGLIDNDKLRHMPRYFDDFKEFDRGEKVMFRQKEDVRCEHYLIILDRAIETFLLHNAAQVGLRVSEFGFSDDQKQFQKALKSQQIEDDPRYLSLLRTLLERQAPDFSKIASFLRSLFPDGTY